MRTRAKAAWLAVACLLLLPGLGLTQRPAPVAVSVIADGKMRLVSSAAGTVGELLIDLGIALGDLDRTSPPLTAELREGAVVQVTRVSCREVTEEVALPAKTTVLAAPKLVPGETKILHRGREGRARRVVQVWAKDGEVTRRVVRREKVLTPPQATVVLRGTAGLPSRGGEFHLPRRMVATAYAARHCGGSANGHAAIGIPAKKGVVAVDPRVISLGTRLYIRDYGFAIAGDTGGAIKGDRIDLCFDTYREALSFGRRSVDVYVLR